MPSDLWDVELLTSTHSLFGQISTHGRRVTDFLNDDSRQLIALSGVRSFPLDQPQKETVFTRFAQVNKDAILIAILEKTSPDWVARQRRRPLEYVPKDRHLVQVTISPFQVTGYVHLIKGITLEQVLLDIDPGFIPISAADIRYLPGEDQTWTVKIRHGQRAQWSLTAARPSSFGRWKRPPRRKRKDERIRGAGEHRGGVPH